MLNDRPYTGSLVVPDVTNCVADCPRVNLFTTTTPVSPADAFRWHLDESYDSLFARGLRLDEIGLGLLTLERLVADTGSAVDLSFVALQGHSLKRQLVTQNAPSLVEFLQSLRDVNGDYGALIVACAPPIWRWRWMLVEPAQELDIELIELQTSCAGDDLIGSLWKGVVRSIGNLV